MSFWRHLFGRKKRHRASRHESSRREQVSPSENSSTESAHTAAPAIPIPQTSVPTPRESTERDLFSRPPATNDVVRVYDRYGRSGLIPRVEWRETILPDALRETWNNPAELASVIQLAIDLHCAGDVVGAARHLFEIDPNPARSVRLLAEAIMRSQDVIEAQRLLEGYIEKHGEESGALASLAQIRYARGRSDWAEKFIWRALELNPNEFTAVLGAKIIARERGAEAETATTLRIAAMPGSWRAQCWLAPEALKGGKLDEALRLYNEALQNSALPIPAELLLNMSDNLGAQGYLVELVNLVGPRFKPAIHGLHVGANLLKAHLDLGQLDAATAILSGLREVKNLSWDGALLHWEMEIAAARREIADQIEVTPENIRYLTFDGPIWLGRTSPATELFPIRPARTATVLFLLHTIEWAELDKESKLRAAACMYTRALPCFFAEQLEFCVAASARIVTPWITQGGILPIPFRCTDEQAARFGNQDPQGAEYIATGHLKAGGKAGHLELRVVRIKDAKLLGVLATNFDLAHPEQNFIQLTRELLELINKETGSPFISPPGQYRPPGGSDFFAYLVTLEDLLTARCVVDAPPTGPDFWLAQRTLIERGISLCLSFPRNVCIRILLAELVFTLSKIDAQIVAEFRDKLALLHKQHTLSEPTNSVVQRLINAALAPVAKVEPI